MAGDGGERFGYTELGRRAQDGDRFLQFLDHDSDRFYQIGVLEITTAAS